MDYRQEQFMRMQQYQYAPQMPFYMSYPIQNIYMTELEYERDMERMKDLYPEEAKRIQKLVEEECDKMEYEGSMMFDEYPDRLMLRAVCDRIYQNAVQPQAQEINSWDTEDWAADGRGTEGWEAGGQGTEGWAANGQGTEGRENDGRGTEGRASNGQEMEGQQLEAEQARRRHRPGGPPDRHPGPGRPPGRHPGPGRRPPHDRGLGNLIEVLLYNEMYKRRCRHNRCRRWW